MDGLGATWLASVAGFALAMSGTPGPNNTMLTASGATFGFRRTVPHMLGVAVGFSAMLVAVTLGAGGVIGANPWLQGALRWVGAAYLLWLAWHIATAQPETHAGSQPARSARPFSFARAALFQWVNPKAWVIALGAVVTYTTANGAALVAQSAALALIFLLVTLPLTALWTAVGVGAAQVLRTPRALRAFNLVLAALLVASLVPLFWDS